MKVRLRPLSKRAKQLVKIHGSVWRVRKQDRNMLIVEPQEQINTDRPYSRIIKVSNDKDFKIKEELKDESDNRR